MLNDLAAILIAEGVEEVETEEEYLAAWQHLIDTGLCWRLQGWFGRAAQRLIEEGKCTKRKLEENDEPDKPEDR